MKNRVGFTLIEILVVIGIIAVLAGLILPSFGTSQMKARDVKRKSDLKQIQKGLELYRQDQNPVAFPTNGTFLTQTTSWSSGATVYMSSVPADPDSTSSTRISYSYTYNNTNLTFSLCACLENAADPTASTTNCSTMTINPRNCTSGKSFIVNEP